jgi:hypothetical protein
MKESLKKWAQDNFENSEDYCTFVEHCPNVDLGSDSATICFLELAKDKLFEEAKNRKRKATAILQNKKKVINLAPGVSIQLENGNGSASGV